jgi:hypothetical protein
LFGTKTRFTLTPETHLKNRGCENTIEFTYNKGKGIENNLAKVTAGGKALHTLALQEQCKELAKGMKNSSPILFSDPNEDPNCRLAPTNDLLSRVESFVQENENNLSKEEIGELKLALQDLSNRFRGASGNDFGNGPIADRANSIERQLARAETEAQNNELIEKISKPSNSETTNAHLMEVHALLDEAEHFIDNNGDNLSREDKENLRLALENLINRNDFGRKHSHSINDRANTGDRNCEKIVDQVNSLYRKFNGGDLEDVFGFNDDEAPAAIPDENDEAPAAESPMARPTSVETTSGDSNPFLEMTQKSQATSSGGDVDRSMFETLLPGWQEATTTDRSGIAGLPPPFKPQPKADPVAPEIPVAAAVQVSSEPPAISPKVANFIQQIDDFLAHKTTMASLGEYLKNINTLLERIENFINKNDLSADDISNLRSALQKLRSEKSIDFGVFGGKCSIETVANENDQVAKLVLSKASSLEKLLDNKKTLAPGELGSLPQAAPAAQPAAPQAPVGEASAVSKQVADFTQRIADLCAREIDLTDATTTLEKDLRTLLREMRMFVDQNRNSLSNDEVNNLRAALSKLDSIKYNAEPISNFRTGKASGQYVPSKAVVNILHEIDFAKIQLDAIKFLPRPKVS